MKRKNLAPHCAKVLGSLLLASSAQAFVTPKNTTGVKLEAVVSRPVTYTPRISNFADVGYTVEKDRASNAIRFISGAGLFDVHVTSDSPKDFEKAALDAVSSQTKIFGVSATDVGIEPNATMVSGDDASVSLYVKRNGIKIQDSGIIFRFKMGTLIHVKLETYSEARVLESKNIDSASIAASTFNSNGYIFQGQVLRVKPTDSGYVLTKVDEYMVPGQDEAYSVQVDTSDGSLFEVKSLNFHLQGLATAAAYPRYFGDRSTQSVLPHLKPSNTTDAANEQGVFVSSDDINAPTLRGLIGQFFKITDLALADLSATASKANNQWLFKFEIPDNETTPWDNAPMAQSMAYIHLSKIRSVAKSFINPSWFDETVTINVNNSKHCNAFWDGKTRSMTFFSAGESGGTTCANTGLIADVMYHEWGHGLDANTGGIKDSGLSEGYGDALAAYMTSDSRIGIDFRPLDHKPVRNVSVKKVYPQDIDPFKDPHKDGLIVAGAWWDLFNALKTAHGDENASKLMGKFLFKGIYEAAKMGDVYTATLALDDDNADPTDGSPNLCIINKAFSEHGLANPVSTCK